MKRLLQVMTIILLASLLVSVPAYFVMQDMLSDPTGRSLRGLVTMLNMPAIWFPVPLAIILLAASLAGCRMTAWQGAVFGALAVISYCFVISIYVLYFQVNSNFRGANFFDFLLTRLSYGLPAIVAATLVTALASWIASWIWGQRHVSQRGTTTPWTTIVLGALLTFNPISLGFISQAMFGDPLSRRTATLFVLTGAVLLLFVYVIEKAVRQLKKRPQPTGDQPST